MNRVCASRDEPRWIHSAQLSRNPEDDLHPLMLAEVPGRLLAPGSKQQTVIVNDETAGLDVNKAAFGQVVTGEEIVDLALNDSNFTQLLLLNSRTVSKSGEQGSLRANEGNALTIQSSRPTSNQYFLDGININDTYYETSHVSASLCSVDSVCPGGKVRDQVCRDWFNEAN